MDREEILKYLQQKYPEDLNENYRCYWWCTSNIDGSALTYYLVLHDKFCETDKEPMICLRAHSSDPEGTEQKAYMNQLRTMLKQNGDIQNLDEPVSSTLLKKYLDKMSDSDPIKKMFKQHKNINAYTKWFNAIPLLGTTALGTNAYFNDNKNE